MNTPNYPTDHFGVTKIPIDYTKRLVSHLGADQAQMLKRRPPYTLKAPYFPPSQALFTIEVGSAREYNARQGHAGVGAIDRIESLSPASPAAKLPSLLDFSHPSFLRTKGLTAENCRQAELPFHRQLDTASDLRATFACPRFGQREVQIWAGQELVQDHRWRNPRLVPNRIVTGKTLMDLIKVSSRAIDWSVVMTTPAGDVGVYMRSGPATMDLVAMKRARYASQDQQFNSQFGVALPPVR